MNDNCVFLLLTDPLNYYGQLCELRNDNIPFSIGHVSSGTTNLSDHSEHLKPMWK